MKENPSIKTFNMQLDLPINTETHSETIKFYGKDAHTMQERKNFKHQQIMQPRYSMKVLDKKKLSLETGLNSVKNENPSTKNTLKSRNKK